MKKVSQAVLEKIKEQEKILCEIDALKKKLGVASTKKKIELLNRKSNLEIELKKFDNAKSLPKDDPNNIKHVNSMSSINSNNKTDDIPEHLKHFQIIEYDNPIESNQPSIEKLQASRGYSTSKLLERAVSFNDLKNTQHIITPNSFENSSIQLKFSNPKFPRSLSNSSYHSSSNCEKSTTADEKLSCQSFDVCSKCRLIANDVSILENSGKTGG